MGLGDLMKSAAPKSLVIKMNLTFLALFLLVYVAILQPVALYDKSASSGAMHCSLRECIMKKVEGRFMKKMVGENRMPKEVPMIFGRALRGASNVKIGVINMGDEAIDWGSLGESVTVDFEWVSENFEWKDLFPEWIDEEEENEGPSCPEIPMPDFSLYDGEEMDMVVARVPCRQPESGWNRDVFRLQVHLVAAHVAAKRGRRDGNGKVRVAVESECRPMMEIFRCDDMVGREGKWWMFEVDGEGLEEKMALPVGSCKLALPLWQQGTYCIISCYFLSHTHVMLAFFAMFSLTYGYCYYV